MTWLDIIKKNNKEFKIEKKEEKQEEIIVESHNYIYQNVDVEFDHLYNIQLTDIKQDFIEYINHLCYPFMDNSFHLGYNIFDYMKQHSCEYSKVIEQVEQVNKDIDKEIEEEQKEMEEEIIQEDEIYDD